MSYNAPGVYSVDRNTTSIGYETKPILSDFRPPEKISKLISSDIKGETAVLSWNPSISLSVVGYQIFRNGQLITTVVGTSYTATGLSESTEYLFTIKSKNSIGTVSDGVSISITTIESDTLDGGTFLSQLFEIEDGGVFETNPLELLDGGAF